MTRRFTSVDEFEASLERLANRDDKVGAIARTYLDALTEGE